LRRWLCHVAEIPDGAARGFEFGSGTAREALFVLRRGDRLFAYGNACPHQGTPLNFLPDRFLDRDGRFLLCTTHGARFRIEDGLCVTGPCLGKSLEPAVIEIENGEIWLAKSSATPRGNS
jgi:nitrite reductase/ring-hydroxylating ferredoxin subunit